MKAAPSTEKEIVTLSGLELFSLLLAACSGDKIKFPSCRVLEKDCFFLADSLVAFQLIRGILTDRSHLLELELKCKQSGALV